MVTQIYSTDTDDGTISVARTSDGRRFEAVATIPVGNAPRGAVKFTKDGRGYVSNCAGNTISEIDVRTSKETARITVGPAPRGIGIVPGDKWALVSNSGSDNIAIVDLKNRRTVHEVSVGRDPRHMAIVGDLAFVAVWGSHYVAVLDLAPLKQGTGAAVREVARIEVGNGVHPYSVAPQPGGERVWVANTRAKHVSVIDVARREVVATVDVGSVGSRAIAFTPDGTKALVSIENTSELLVVDTARLAVERKVPVGAGPRGLAIDLSHPTTVILSAFARTQPNNSESAALKANSLTVVDLERPGKLLQIPVGQGSCSVSVLDLGTLDD